MPCFAVSHAVLWELSLVFLINVLYSASYTYLQKDQLEILKSEPYRALGSLLIADGQSSHRLLRGRPEGAS